MSASDTSDISVNKIEESDDISDQLATSQNVLNDDKYWWNTQSSSDESDNNKEEGLKDGSTWLKASIKSSIKSSDTKSEEQVVVRSSDGLVNHPLVSEQDSTPLVLPTAAASESQSSGEDFTHDSLGPCVTSCYVNTCNVFIYLVFVNPIVVPSIAQLVERWTVVVY